MNGLTESLRAEVGERLARRPWPATPIRADLDVSFEFFPPASTEHREALVETAQTLGSLEPAFVSVTYGAGGSSQERTIETVDALKNNTRSQIAAHLTCVGASRARIDEVVDTYVGLGVSHIVALRGDAPSEGVEGGELEDAAQLVTALRDRPDASDLEISVAAYPETHPKARSPKADLDALKRKVDAGADRAITQFFFDPDDFLRFVDSARAHGISVPIVPGIMPVYNFEKVASFAARCGARIPAWMPALFDGLDDARDVSQMVAATVAAEMCRYLVERGITSFHFYTLNRPDLSMAVCRTLGVGSAPASAKATNGLAS